MSSSEHCTKACASSGEAFPLADHRTLFLESTRYTYLHRHLLEPQIAAQLGIILLLSPGQRKQAPVGHNAGQRISGGHACSPSQSIRHAQGPPDLCGIPK